MLKYILAMLSCCAFSSFAMDGYGGGRLKYAPTDPRQIIIANTHIVFLAEQRGPYEGLATEQRNAIVESFNKQFGYPDISYLNRSLENLSKEDKILYYRCIFSNTETIDAKLVKLARRSEGYFSLNDDEWCMAVKSFNDSIGTPTFFGKSEAIRFTNSAEEKKFLKRFIKTEVELAEEDEDDIKPKKQNIYLKLSKENTNPNVVNQHKYASTEHYRRWEQQRKKITKISTNDPS